MFSLAMMAEKLDAETIPHMKKTAGLKTVMLKILERRWAMYATPIEEDERVLETDLPVRKRMAVEVRLGEKRIIKKAMGRIEAWDVPPPSKRIKT